MREMSSTRGSVVHVSQFCQQTGLEEGEQRRKGRLMCSWQVQILTIIVNQKGNIGGQDLIVADLAVLW